MSAVKAALEAAGISASQYTGHSFGIGAATTAAHAGIPDSLIQVLGSSVYTTFILQERGCVQWPGH